MARNTLDKKVRNVLRCINEKWKKRSRKNSLASYFSFIAMIFAFVFSLHWIFSPKEDIFDLIKENILDLEFSGGSVCGVFPCFGSSPCQDKLKLIQVNLSRIRESRGWIHIEGVTRDHHLVEKAVVVNIPSIKALKSESLCVDISGRTFKTRSYQSWVCLVFGRKPKCDVEDLLQSWRPMKMIQAAEGRLDPAIIRGLSPPLQCASTRIADRLLRRFFGPGGKGSLLLRDFNSLEKAELVFTCKASPEVIMQRLFPPMEGWLTNNAIGSCGLVTTHFAAVMTSLFDLYSAPWNVRMDVAVQLLDLARYFTENDSSFLLLIHNLTPNDIGISERGKLRIRHSSNIVVVDTADSSQGFSSKFYETPYNKQHFAIPEINFCKYNQTDINYYTVCNHFLTGTWTGLDGKPLKGGLLHDPQGLSSFQTNLFVTLDLCSRGSKAVPKDHPRFSHSVRATAAGKLRSLLDMERGCGPEFRYRYPECELLDPINTQLYVVPQFELKWLRP